MSDTFIPFFRPSISDKEIQEVVDCLKSGWLTTGPRTKQFEYEFRTRFGNQHAVAVNSCTAALHLALEAVGVKKGDSVLVPTMTFAATAEVVRYFDAKPLLVDCSEDDFNLDVGCAEAEIERAISRGERVVAIVPVHYAGQIGNVAGVTRLSQRFGLHIIEDAAHCCPAHYRISSSEPWKNVGCGSDISCFSFYANKTITTGEGGMACTDNEEYADRMRIMSLHGISKDAWKRFRAEGDWYYEISAPGFKYNLTDVAAAIGIHQLRRVDELHQKRSAVAMHYAQLLGGVEEIVLPKTMENRIHSWHLFVIRLRLELLSIGRREFIQELKECGIGASVHWMPLHMHPYYRDMYGYRRDSFPVATRLYNEIVSLPIYPDITEEQIKRICYSIKQIINRYRMS